MYIATIPNRQSPPAILLRESFREQGKVRTRTLANLTTWPPARIEALRRALQGEFDGLHAACQPVCGPIFGVLFVLKQLAARVGLPHALGTDRLGKLALLLILARVAHQGSRLSTLRWATHQAVAETLGLGRFDKDALYTALDWLAQRQDQIEQRLYRHGRRHENPPAAVLYDVTSSYVEGEHNELAAFGYNRDKKGGKAQVVIGLVTTAEGTPMTVHVYAGNTSDPSTLHEQVKQLQTRFGITDVVFVGDGGMVKSKGKDTLRQAGYRYITALTTPQVRKLLKAEVLRLEHFAEQVYEVEHGAVRLLLRRNAATQRREQRRRADKLVTLQERVTARNVRVEGASRAKPEAGLRTLNAWVTRHKLASFVTLSLRERTIMVTIDAAAQTDAAQLDGCYVLETDVPSGRLTAQTVHDRYLDLQRVEQDFRTMKTGLLEVRPLFVRKAERTRAHVFVTMLALHVVQEMRRALVATFGTTADDTMAVTVEEALVALSRLCLLRYDTPAGPVTRLPHPDAQQTAILRALRTPLPARRTFGPM
jgi:transposase